MQEELEATFGVKEIEGFKVDFIRIAFHNTFLEIKHDSYGMEVPSYLWISLQSYCLQSVIYSYL
jgi:hypothetical protein